MKHRRHVGLPSGGFVALPRHSRMSQKDYDDAKRLAASLGVSLGGLVEALLLAFVRGDVRVQTLLHVYDVEHEHS